MLRVARVWRQYEAMVIAAAILRVDPVWGQLPRLCSLPP
jgi:hypothetical protein